MSSCRLTCIDVLRTACSSNNLLHVWLLGRYTSRRQFLHICRVFNVWFYLNWLLLGLLCRRSCSILLQQEAAVQVIGRHRVSAGARNTSYLCVIHIQIGLCIPLIRRRLLFAHLYLVKGVVDVTRYVGCCLQALISIYVLPKSHKHLAPSRYSNVRWLLRWLARHLRRCL